MSKSVVSFILMLTCSALFSGGASAQVCDSIKNCQKLKSLADKRIQEISLARDRAKAEVRIRGTDGSGESTTKILASAWNSNVACVQSAGNDLYSYVILEKLDYFSFQMGVPSSNFAEGRYDLAPSLQASIGTSSLKGSKSCLLTITANDSKVISGSFDCTRTMTGGLSMGTHKDLELDISGSFSCPKNNYCLDDYDVGTPEFKKCTQSVLK